MRTKPFEKSKIFQSFQVLRGRAHWLLKKIFPDRQERYRWLRRNFHKMHASRMNKVELAALIEKLEPLYENRA